MLSGPGQFAENETNEVNFREIPSHSCRRSACTLHTKPGTPIRPPKSPSSQFLPRSLSSFSWLQTSWTAEILPAFFNINSGWFQWTIFEKKNLKSSLQTFVKVYIWRFLCCLFKLGCTYL